MNIESPTQLISRSVISLLCILLSTVYRDITLLIALLLFNIMDYSNLFQYFFSMYTVLLLKIPNFSSFFVINNSCNVVVPTVNMIYNTVLT